MEEDFYFCEFWGEVYFYFFEFEFLEIWFYVGALSCPDFDGFDTEVFADLSDCLFVVAWGCGEGENFFIGCLCFVFLCDVIVGVVFEASVAFVDD